MQQYGTASGSPPMLEKHSAYLQELCRHMQDSQSPWLRSDAIMASNSASKEFACSHCQALKGIAHLKGKAFSLQCVKLRLELLLLMGMRRLQRLQVSIGRLCIALRLSCCLLGCLTLCSRCCGLLCQACTLCLCNLRIIFLSDGNHPFAADLHLSDCSA